MISGKSPLLYQKYFSQEELLLNKTIGLQWFAAEDEGRQQQQQPAFGAVFYAAEALEKNATQQQLFQNRRK